MKVIILAGGLGTRLSEETQNKPKPMVRLGDKPILWHIIQTYSQQGFREFVIAAGYKHEMITEWIQSETTQKSEWLSGLHIQVKDTGQETNTGGRIAMCINSLKGEEFLFTYGDGVANVNLSELHSFHRQSRTIATLTAVRPPARFGHITLDGSKITHFGEKNQADEGWINGGFFVTRREIVNYINGNEDSLEFDVLPILARENNLSGFKHYGFWQSMDTLRDKEKLESLALGKEYEKLPWLTL